jgi:class 3 adenylate cyclase/tetratricopeptide (TPR) repeat protein
MQCPQCQFENREGVRFCEECGAKLEQVCPSCGAAVPPGRKFCGECGARLTAVPSGVPAAQLASRYSAPQTYTPQHLAERIISSRGALEGERKQVTVLFADLKGSMELLADRDPEEARHILDPVLERMMTAVHRYEGTVNQVMGDGIMALFGAPIAHEDHAVRACYAAMRMQEAVKAFAQEVQRTQGLPLHIRVGLNSGEVVVRSIASDLHMDYTAVGQTTHLAARMEQLAMPGSILLAPDTLQLAEGYVQVKALGPMAVKGLGEPIAVYELTGAGTARSRLQAAAVRGLTRFVGREVELETLRRTLEQAGGGRGQVVALVGEPGVGKSRLVWEFSHSHRTQDWLVLESGSVSYGKATSYLPVIDLLKTYCGIEDRDDDRRVREKLTGKLLALDPAFQPALPAFLALLDVPVDDTAWQALDPPRRQQRTLDAVKRLLLRESQEQPLLLVFEDVHWIDTESQALLDTLVESLPTARVLLLVNYRPEYEHGWHRKTCYQQLRLDPLPPESADALLQALLGDDPSLQPLKLLLIARTEGNPFFLEESVRTLVETGTLVGERGAYRLARPAAIQVPATVQAVLAARIDRLSPEDKQLLQAAAVIGKDVPYALLQAIAELPTAPAREEDALRQGLARLQAAEFLYETSLFPEPEYTFKHALTHEVAYGSLLHERRRALHARIADAMQQLYADRLAEQTERLAHHARRGEVWDKAVEYCRRAAARANTRSAHREALACFQDALEALSHLPESRAIAEAMIDVRLEMRNSLHELDDHQGSVRALQEAGALARELRDQRRLGAITAYIANHHLRTGNLDEALTAGQRALAIGRMLEDPAVQRLASYYVGQIYASMGDYPQALELFTRTFVERTDDRGGERLGQSTLPGVGVLGWLVRCLAACGDFEAGLTRAKEAVDLAGTGDHLMNGAYAWWGMGYLLLSRGDPSGAVPALERSMDIFRASRTHRLFGWIAGTLGQAYLLAGRLDEAISILEQAAEHAATTWCFLQAPIWASLSEAYLLADQVAEGVASAERAVALAREHGERANEAVALRAQGNVYADARAWDGERAEDLYHEALALAEQLGMRPLQAHCHLGLGTLYQKISREEQAHAELVTAAELYRAMEMPFWLEKAEALRAQAAH